MFSMFFGAGNLVFPLALGSKTAMQALPACVGLFITAVLVPFLGLLSIIVYNGNKDAFFNSIGRLPAFVLMFIMLCLMGPLGAIPRCIVVAYGGVELWAPSFPFWAFGIVFCLINLLVIWNYNKIIPIIGAWLTPIFIGGILALFFFGFYHKVTFEPMVYDGLKTSGLGVFGKGLTTGYQTLDLLAAFFFCSTTINYLKEHIHSRQAKVTLMPLSLITSLLGASLLGLTYIGFVALGNRYAPILQGVPSHHMVVVIANHVLGSLATPLVSLTIFLACMTTVAVLITLFADFLNENISKNRLGRHKAIGITLLLSYSVSMLGFDRIYKTLAEVLYLLYPAIIALCLANLAEKYISFNYSKRVFWLVSGLSLIYRLTYA